MIMIMSMRTVMTMIVILFMSTVIINQECGHAYYYDFGIPSMRMLMIMLINMNMIMLL